MKTDFSFVAANFKLNFGVPDIEHYVSYENPNNQKVRVTCHSNSFSDLLKKDPKLIWKEWQGKKYPLIVTSEDSVDVDLVTNLDDHLRINFDIISIIFLFLSGYQEFDSNSKDHYDRFPYKESLQCKLSFITIPLVDYCYELILDCIKAEYGEVFKTRREKPTIAVTHDIDSSESAWLEGGFHSLKKGDLITPIKLLVSKITSNDKWFNFSEIMEYEKSLGFHSTFFFLPRQGKKYGVLNADYNFNKPKYKKIIEEIKEEGSEVGVHGSFGTHDNLQYLEEDIETIGGEIVSNRFHYLQFSYPESNDVLNRSCIKYDSTLGFAEHFGFRNATCKPFYLYNFKSNKRTSVIEIPMIIMDGTFQNKAYMGIEQNEVLQRIQPMLAELIKFNGTCSLLWHNTHYSSYKFKGWKEVLTEILLHLKGQNAELSSLAEAIKMKTY